MAKVIVWKRADGGISDGTPVPGKKARMIEQYEKTEEGKNAIRLSDRDASELPDREFRDAWRAKPDGTIRVDALVKQQIIAERAKPTTEERLVALEAKRETP